MNSKECRVAQMLTRFALAYTMLPGEMGNKISTLSHGFE
jgi:hypothetical protein